MWKSAVMYFNVVFNLIKKLEKGMSNEKEKIRMIEMVGEMVQW